MCFQVSTGARPMRLGMWSSRINLCNWRLHAVQLEPSRMCHNGISQTFFPGNLSGQNGVSHRDAWWLILFVSFFRVFSGTLTTIIILIRWWWTMSMPPSVFAGDKPVLKRLKPDAVPDIFVWSRKQSSAQQLSRQKRLLKRQIVSSTVVAASMSRNLDDNEQSPHYDVDFEGPTVEVPVVIEPAWWKVLLMVAVKQTVCHLLYRRLRRLNIVDWFNKHRTSWCIDWPAFWLHLSAVMYVIEHGFCLISAVKV